MKFYRQILILLLAFEGIRLGIKLCASGLDLPIVYSYLTKAIRMIQLVFVILGLLSLVKIMDKKMSRGLLSKIKVILINIYVSVVLFFGLESGIRIIKADYRWKNRLETYLMLSDPKNYPALPDSVLGYIPKPEYSSSTINIDEKGLRSNMNHNVSFDSIRIIACGDSYTFGDQVADSSSWPAILEKYSGHKVYNGGVFGYGLDQSCLMAKRLVHEIKSDYVILSFIDDDVNRCGLKKRMNVYKPYFTIENNELKLHTNHLTKKFEKVQLSMIKQYLSYSLLVNELMLKIAPEYWLIYVSKTYEGTDKLAKLLIEDLNQFCKENSNKLIIVCQYDVKLTNRYSSELVSFCRKSGIGVVDLLPVLQELKMANPGVFDQLYFADGGHMTPSGNQLVALEIQKALGQTANF